jgi:hypothetical protein
MATGIWTPAAYPPRHGERRRARNVEPRATGRRTVEPAAEDAADDPNGGAMKFLAIIYNDESSFADATPEQIGELFAAHGAFGEAATKAGVYVGGEGLQPTATATTVRVRDGERLLTDGPYAETKEQIGGYYLLDCKDLDDALNWAAQIPEAKTGAIEVRPIMDYEAMESFAKSGGATAS